jgi:GNAT superfamily N-acetyltransferase
VGADAIAPGLSPQPGYLAYAEPVTSPSVLHPAVRPAEEGDCERIRQLIVELAVYERSELLARATTDQLRAALFAPEPAAYALVAEVSAEVVGFALYFRSFSTWEGVHGIYLEDLYVSAQHRGTGLGKALLQSLAALAVSRGYARCEWSVLDWNQPSIDFYRAMGAEPMTGWTVYRLSGEALRRAAAGRG